MIKVVIIEDDKSLAATLMKILSEVAPQCKVMGIAPSVKEAKQLIDDVKPDIAFFDVELEDGLSFDLLEQLTDINFEIIFVTAYSSYAFNAFKYSAIDFIVKPVDPDDISRAVSRAVKSLSKNDISKRIDIFLQNKKEEQVINQRITLRTSASTHYVQIKDIIRCESDINYTTFHLVDGKKIVVSKTMGEFEKMLPEIFFRVHRSHLVNLGFIVEVQKRSNTVFLSNKEKVPVSIRKKEGLLSALKIYNS